MEKQNSGKSASPPCPLQPKVIITGHVNADFDCLAAMVAAGKLYPDATLVYPGSKERAVNSFFMQRAYSSFGFYTMSEIDFSQVELLVAVDTRQRKRLPHVETVFANPGLRVHVFDHHPPNEDDIEAEFIRIENWGATVSILIEELKARNISLTPDEATLLGIGLYEDTGSLVFSSTTEHDLLAAAWLLGQKMDLNVIAELIRKTMTPDQVALLHTMLESGHLQEINGIPILIMDVALETFVGDFSDLVQHAMQMTRSKVIFALAAMGDKVQIVARSSVPEVDCSRICASFGGGGHAGAASASVKDKTLSEAREALFGLLFSLVNSQILVRDIMSSPPHFVRENHSIAEAEEIMVRYALKAMPVVSPDTGLCTGIIEHQLAAKALVHGLGEQSVSEYMSRAFFSIDAASSLYSLMEIVIDEQQSLIPVLDNKRLIGVVSRTDIMEALLEDTARVPEALPPEDQKSRNIQSFLLSRLPDEHIEWLRAAGQKAESMGMEVYAVGGFVRDLLLGKPNFDIDLVVEGDGIEFARAFSEDLGGRIRPHHEFKTAAIIFHDEQGVRQRIDVATARLEYYKHPAAMPTIELSSIKMDLYRRDFTINALAVHLNPERFGLLVDFFGGQRDMKEKIVRVLHALSFVEDPTRILRAVRFEQRFKFNLSNQTERLIKNALKLNVLDKLSGSRIFNELQLMMEEDSPLSCFLRMDRLRLADAIHPLLKISSTKEESIVNLEKTLSWHRLSYFSPLADPWICYFLCLCGGAKYLDAASLLERMGFNDNARKNFLSMREEVNIVLKKIQKMGRARNSLSMSAFHDMLGELPTEAILYILSNMDDEEERKPLVHYITAIRNMKADISGEDLIALGGTPGPVFGEILRQVFRSKLDGQAVSRTAQLNLARELLDSMQGQPQNVD
ncbi:MAG: CBS domain-containing protein [Desulfovibrionaceae bacterium]|nr:CBS domain-containing protein [Desulfovibrionaceae bacterium]